MSVRDLLMSFSRGVTNAPVGSCNNTTIVSNDIYPYDQFGWSVSLGVNGNMALISASAKSTDSLDSFGAAYVFTNISGTWTQVAELTASDAASYDNFGYSVSLSSDGNTALIGAYQKTVNAASYAGAAYVFSNVSGTWTQISEFTLGNAAAYDNFGSSVSLSSDGNTALIGAPYKTINGIFPGSAYIYTIVSGTWTQVAELTASDLVNGDFFGCSVSLSSGGNTALIGAPSKTVNGVTGAGVAYIFSNVSGTWAQVAELTTSDASQNGNFGWAVSLSADGNTALIGAYQKTVNGLNYVGVAYVFSNVSGTWTQVAELTASDAAGGDRFGYSVSLSIDGNTALIGAMYKTVNGARVAGAAYIFSNVSGTWTQVTKLTANNPAGSDRFGWSASISPDGNRALIGAFYKTVNGLAYAGAAYVFSNYTGVWCQE